MKLNKKVSALFLAVFLTCCMALSACGGGEPAATDPTNAPLSATAEYKVNVKDPFGNPYTGIIVRFLKDGEQAAMLKVGDTGSVSKELPRADYTVELSFTGDAADYYYNKDAMKLSAEVTELNVDLYKAVNSEGFDLHAAGVAYKSYDVTTGCTYVELNAGAMNYFVFTPDQAGTYEFSVIGDAELGYYGMPHFIQEMSVVDVKDNKFTESISGGMIGTGNTGTAQLVLGLKAGEGVKNAVLCIERIGDPAWSVEDEPWSYYMTTVDLEEYVLPEDTELMNFDVTAETGAYNLVFNEADGFYHLDSVDGPLVYVMLGEDSDYMACFKTVIENSDVNRYFFDENGAFIKKERYTDCLLEYIDCMDAELGVYPLTKDLEYIIKNRGEYAGWWDKDAKGMFIFKDVNGDPIEGLNPEIAWLFMCCYAAS